MEKLKNLQECTTTHKRLTKNPKRRAKIAKEYKQLLLSELLLELMEKDPGLLSASAHVMAIGKK